MSYKIEEIMRNFKFKDVQKTMVALNWRWAFSASDASGVPIMSEIKDCARDLLKRANEAEGKYFISTGGFTARKHKNGHLSLSFCVSSWSSDVERI